MTRPIALEQSPTQNRCERCLVHNRGLCRHAHGDVLIELNQISHHRKCATGEIIQAQGLEADLVGNVVNGVLKISKNLPDGREQVVGLLYPTDFFGRVYADQAEFTIEAATDATICTMDRHAFELLIERHKEIEHNLMLSAFDELDAAREWMVLLGCQNTLEKISGFFLTLLKRADKQCLTDIPYKQGEVVVFPINRRDIAAYLGTTVETLSRQIQHLSRKNVIRILDAKHFEILNEDRLIELAGQDPSSIEALLR